MNTPKLDGFHTRGEHERHSGTIIIYPERTDIWRNDAVIAQNLIIKLANLIINYEDVFFCVKPRLVSQVKRILDSRVTLIEIEYDDIWARDISPNFVVNSNEIRAVCWGFNSWGGIEEGAYYPWDKDAAFAKTLSDILGMKKYVVDDVVLEGGAVIADGKGTLYTTKSVLLNRNRNPSLTLAQVEDYLYNYFCADKIVWLENGLTLDETGGHIDNVCSIIRPNEICLASTNYKNNPQYEVAKNAFEVLRKSDSASTIHELPIPALQYISADEARGLVQKEGSTNRVEGFPLVPSYINYYLANSALIMPKFMCEEDEIAHQILGEIFPDREIVQLEAREILIGGGGFHCILHEVPSIG